jgi:hypothetical protein
MMRLPTSLIIVALASMLVALVVLGPLAQQDPPIVNPPIVNPPLVDLPTVGPPVVRPPRQQAFGGRVDATPALPQKPKRAFYYRLGDLKGVPYDTIEECTKVLKQAGGVGVCVYK